MNNASRVREPAKVDPLSATDLTDPAIVADPHPTYGALLARTPVVWNDQLKGWVLTRHADVQRALRDPGLSVEKLQPFVARSQSEQRDEVEALGRVLSDWMVFRDPPRHTNLRRALKDAFMPAEIAALAPRVRAIADDLLAEVTERSDWEFVDAFAGPMPTYVIGDLFGLPREYIPLLRVWSDHLGRFVLAATDDDDIYSKAGAAVRAMTDRFAQLVDDHRARPRDDFTSRLIENGAELTNDEIVHTLVLILWAGHETTTNLLATSLFHLARDPESYRRLRDAPELIPQAVDEFLRLDGPAQMLVRLAKEDVSYGGQSIRAGERRHDGRDRRRIREGNPDQAVQLVLAPPR